MGKRPQATIWRNMVAKCKKLGNIDDKMQKFGEIGENVTNGNESRYF